MHKIYIVLLLTGLFFQATAGGDETPCQKCNTEKVKAIELKMMQLTEELVADFLCTFDEQCRNNQSYQEWANVVLFRLVDYSAQMFLDVVANNENINVKELAHQFEYPGNDFMDIDETYVKIKAAKTRNSKTQQKFLKALKAAAHRMGKTISE